MIGCGRAASTASRTWKLKSVSSANLTPGANHINGIALIASDLEEISLQLGIDSEEKKALFKQSTSRLMLETHRLLELTELVGEEIVNDKPPVLKFNSEMQYHTGLEEDMGPDSDRS